SAFLGAIRLRFRGLAFRGGERSPRPSIVPRAQGSRDQDPRPHGCRPALLADRASCGARRLRSRQQALHMGCRRLS
ncbi:hypothetical protein PHISP_08800, partial [Aspergillus sp. HF37]